MVNGDSGGASSRTTIEHVAGGPPSSRRGGGHAALIVYQRGGAELVELPQDRMITLGREWPADVLVSDPSLSRQHARFGFRERELHVEDLGSRNGTWVSGKRVQDSVLRSGSVVQLGGVMVSVHVSTPGGVVLRGLDTYDSLVATMDEELARARHFSRNFALLSLCAVKGTLDGHVSRWCPRVRAEIRDVDRLATYGADSALLLLPEADAEFAEGVAKKLVAARSGEPPLAAGVAVYPSSATSVDELVAAARTASITALAGGTITLSGSAGIVAKADEGVVATSPKMRELFQLVSRVARTTVPVLLLGETGAGKEVVARAIHERSARADGPLQSVNCAAIPAGLTESVLFGHERGAFTSADRTKKGLFEDADGGTLLLDEIGELPLPAQAALLRVLETKRVVRVGGNRELSVDVRVVASTHRDLESMVASGAFREDLLFRLNTVTLHVPPLRERVDEIPALSNLFVRTANAAWGTKVTEVSPEALEALSAYQWPGNVRELRNAMERAVAISGSGRVELADLPERVRTVTSVPPPRWPEPGPVRPTNSVPADDRAFRERVREFESQLIIEALERTDGNQSRAAELLRMPLRTLVHKIRAHGLKKKYEP